MLAIDFTANYTPPNIKPEAKLIFDSLKFTFNAWPTNITIAWKFENNRTCTPPVTFTIQQSVCDEPNRFWNTTDLEYSLPLSLFADDHNYLTLFASDSNGNECTRSQAKFQVFQNCEYKKILIARIVNDNSAIVSGCDYYMHAGYRSIFFFIFVCSYT